MKILIELEIENEIDDEEQLIDDLDECLGDFILCNEQTYYAKTNFIVNSDNIRKYSEV